MTKPIDPYSRVYWRVAEDERFAAIYPDDHHLATWLRLLMLADAMYPTAAPVPATARAASVKALADCGLIELLPGGLYRVHGLAAERSRRGAGRDPERHPTGTPPAPTRTLARAGVDETRRDETSQDEHRASGLDAAESHVFSRIAKAGAFIRPDSPMGRRVVTLIARRGPVAVSSELDRLTARGQLSDRQIVFGLEEALDKIPTAHEAVTEARDEAEAIKAKRRDEQVWGRRVEAYRFAGTWDDAWGPKPEVPA